MRPDSGEISVEDNVRVEDPTAAFEFVLNAGLSVQTADGTLQTLATSADGLRKAYRVSMQTPGRSLTLRYQGRPRFSGQRTHGGMPIGSVSEEGVYLDGASAWFPLFDLPIDRVRMAVSLPAGWQAVGVGGRSRQDGQVNWTSDQPHDALYLIANRFTRYHRSHGAIDLSVWLLKEDAALAETYLGVMGDYIDHYSRLIGDYPYEKFAVVENPWQTGFGMPSFTLLGSQVMRLPFIPYTSLPHEILHNWWGNGVWVDYQKGNWSEGLTAYMADHWMQERQGKGRQYRLKALQRYSNFAADGEDMPLLQFVSRHNDTSQSIGYSKSLMLFHMLRTAMGDAAFSAGLQRLWQQHRFSPIGFADAIDSITGPDRELAAQARQWLERPDAPRLRLVDVGVEASSGTYRLTLDIAQENAPPFAFDLPVAVSLSGETSARLLQARVDKPRNRLVFDLPGEPLRVDIDPEYDLLRYLDPTEQPPALNQLFGGTDSWLVIPAAAPAPMREAWMALARQWQARYPGLQVADDGTLLPPSANRLLLGWENRLLARARAGFARDGQTLEDDAAVVRGTRYGADEAGVVLVANDASGVATGFVGAATPQAVASLARKLTHYGSYGRLVFDADSGANQVRDSLTSVHSRLSRQLGQAPVPLQLTPRAALGEADTATAPPVAGRQSSAR